MQNSTSKPSEKKTKATVQRKEELEQTYQLRPNLYAMVVLVTHNNATVGSNVDAGWAIKLPVATSFRAKRANERAVAAKHAHAMAPKIRHNDLALGVASEIVRRDALRIDRAHKRAVDAPHMHAAVASGNNVVGGRYGHVSRTLQRRRAAQTSNKRAVGVEELYAVAEKIGDDALLARRDGDPNGCRNWPSPLPGEPK